MDVNSAQIRLISARLRAKKRVRMFRKYAWLAVALILIFVSVWLTWVLTYVAEDASGLFKSTLNVEVSRLDNADFPVYLFMLQNRTGYIAEFGFPETGAPVEFGLSHLTHENPCHVEESGPRFQISYRSGGSAGLTVFENGSNKHFENRITTISVKPEETAPMGGAVFGYAHLICKLEFQPFRRTFTDRSVVVQSSVPGGTKGIVVDFTGLRGTSGLQLIGGTNEHVRRPDQRFVPSEFVGKISAEWKDVKSEQIRDAGLVLVGTLLGLAASFLLEWLRPYVGPGGTRVNRDHRKCEFTNR